MAALPGILQPTRCRQQSAASVHSLRHACTDILAPARLRHRSFSQRSRSQPARQRSFPPAASGDTNVKLVGVEEVRMTLVKVEVEEGPRNSRRLYAGINIAAPWDVVWGALTNYDGLANFIPGLKENKCLERRPAGARLLQVGEQSLGLGARFRARVVLDIQEHPSGLASHLVDDQMGALAASLADDVLKVHVEQALGAAADKTTQYPPLQLCDGWHFPGPRSSTTAESSHDISFALHEGDFQAFKGVWRIQQISNGTAKPSTRLSYALFVRPQKWLPIQLIQNRIQGEVVANLTAVRAYTEQSL